MAKSAPVSVVGQIILKRKQSNPANYVQSREKKNFQIVIAQRTESSSNLTFISLRENKERKSRVSSVSGCPDCEGFGAHCYQLEVDPARKRPTAAKSPTSSLIVSRSPKEPALRNAVGQRVPSDRRSSATWQGPPADGARPNFHKQSPSIMPVTNRVGLPTAEYLKAQPPSWESIQTGLSIFALFVIIRYCVQQIYSWLRPAERLDPSSYYHPTNDLLQQRYQPQSWSMDEKSSQGDSVGGGMNNQHQNFNNDGATAIPIDSHWRPTGDSMPRHFISRLPPALPLTPPELSSAVFTLDERPQDHESFIHQPNPDYMSSTSSSSFQADDTDSSIPRRRSYTRTLPIGAPIIRQGQPSTEAESGDQAFSPSSFPGSSQLLPPAPPLQTTMSRRSVTLTSKVKSSRYSTAMEQAGLDTHACTVAEPA
ncbi:hypothetical protein PT974_05585 [Cladobotryum mycophilum]|uniref:Uncharacterized protein n=1 Tax=Cladobotryum mycophilum TaxID=491253 RepID=A0ABR0SJ42_9HYPO